VLAPGVIVDAQRFEHEAGVALSAAVGDRVGAARTALTRATGELLPADHDTEWTTALRERLVRLHLALLDLVAADAIERGDLDDAARVLDIGIGVDPDEEDRYVRLARVLMRQGRTQAARRIAHRGLDACAELEVEPGMALRALVDELARHAA
jgi:DNA-binding SARP family transcriptional activator